VARSPRGCKSGVEPLERLGVNGTDRMTGMNATSYSKLAAAIFAIIALLQLARALTGWQIMFNGMTVPIWPSWIACGVAIVLAWLGFSASRA
jgi:hypothetical protein